MAAWLAQNIGSIAVFALLAAVVAAIIAGMVRSKKQGKSTCSCGGTCGCCPMAGKCGGGAKKTAGQVNK